jgi:CubicO group peptidase (beta-lactamase class C family)
LLTRCRVPASLEEVTAVGAEAPARDLGVSPEAGYGMGFMLGGQWFSPYGPDTQYAFGHIGFTNVLTWADPERQVAAALLTSGKPLVYPELYYVWDVLRQIGLACGKERARPRAAAAAAQRSVS